MRTMTRRIDLSGPGLETTSADEYLTRPDLRQIATFFSGILFATSLYYFLHSPTLTLIFSRFLRRRAAAPTADINARQGTLSNASTSTLTQYDPLALVFLLDLVYMTTAATQFGSLLSFSSANGAVPCTFLVAWGALGSETVRMIGLLKLSIHLRERGASQWEKYILWGALTISAIVMFLTAVVNTGVLRPISHWDSLSFCYIRHFFVGAAAGCSLNLVIELFVLARFISLLFPLIPAINSRIQMVTEVQICRALSLVLLDGATIYPSLYPTSLLADFIPFSAVSILVLTAFNHNTIPKHSLVSSILNVNQPSLPQSLRIPTPNFSPFLNLEASAPSSKERSLGEFNLDRELGPSTRVFDAEKGIPHPFANVSVTNHRQLLIRLPRQRRDPTGTAGSVLEPPGAPVNTMPDAVVAANRTLLYPADGPVLPPTGTLHTQSQRDEIPPMRRPKSSQGGSPRRSFLPALRARLTGSVESSTLQFRVPNPPSGDTQIGRQILVRQAEVADQMFVGPRRFHPERRPLGNPSSVSSHDNPAPSTPPAPPRIRRILREGAHPMVVLSEDYYNPGETRPSTAESVIVFGSDILLRSQDDIMRARGEIIEGNGGSREASAGHSNGGGSSGSFEDQSDFNLRIVSRSQQSLRPSTGGRRDSFTGDITQPHTDPDALPVVHEGSPSSARTGESHASRNARNAHRRRTFGIGELLFERFQRGFTISDASYTHTAEHTSPVLSTHAHHEPQGDRSRLSRVVPGSRLRSSTVGSSPGTRKQQKDLQERPST